MDKQQEIDLPQREFPTKRPFSEECLFHTPAFWQGVKGEFHRLSINTEANIVDFGNDLEGTTTHDHV